MATYAIVDTFGLRLKVRGGRLIDYNKVKLCKKCKVEPALQQSTLCVNCKKDKAHYDKDYYKQNATEKTASATQTKKDIVKWYYALKDNKNCQDCMGQYRYWQQDYDHLPSFTKFMDVSKMVRLGYAKEKIMNEIAKCSLICKNCHSTRTHMRATGLKGSKNTYD